MQGREERRNRLFHPGSKKEHTTDSKRNECQEMHATAIRIHSGARMPCSLVGIMILSNISEFRTSS